MRFLVLFVGLALVSFSSVSGGEKPACLTLIQQGAWILENRPMGHVGETGPDGRPLTENARRYDAETNAALDVWARAQEVCSKQAAKASETALAAKLTAASFEVAARAFEIRGEQKLACEQYESGIDAVRRIDERSPDLAHLYNRFGFCVADFDRARGVRMIETGLDLAIETFGATDARVVEHMVDLALALPYAIHRYGEMDGMSGPEVDAVEQRVAELRRSAWQIVRDDPDASEEAIRRAAIAYRLWQADHGGDEAETRRLEAELIAKRRPDKGR